MNHYYTNDPDLEHNEHSFNFDLGGHSLHFTTDNGVFSKHTIDFGSRVLIETVLNQENLPAGDILDVGCGYGPIGIALAKTLGRNVTMSDVNERAMALAKRNAEANGVTAQTTIIESSAYANITGEFGFIVTNPPYVRGRRLSVPLSVGPLTIWLRAAKCSWCCRRSRAHRVPRSCSMRRLVMQTCSRRTPVITFCTRLSRRPSC